jgi:hypothetical protein
MANLGERSNDTAKMFGEFLKCFKKIDRWSK